MKTAAQSVLAYKLADGRFAFSDPSSALISVDESAMSAKFRVTEEKPDRVGDVIVTAGVGVDNFARNPIGFFDHQKFPLPICKWEDPAGKLSIERHMGGPVNFIDGVPYFSQKSPEALQVFVLVQEKILRACSIGFNPAAEPIRRNASPGDRYAPSGHIYPAIDLLEISIVGIPCLPTATRVRSLLSGGKIGGETIGPLMRKSLEPLAEKRRAFLYTGGEGGKVTTKNVTDASGHVHGDDGKFGTGGSGKKQPHEMNSTDYANIIAPPGRKLPNGDPIDETGRDWAAAKQHHETHVRTAIEAGKVVPPHVLEEYPGLKPKKPKGKAPGKSSNTSKSMNESNGAAGGYAVGNEDEVKKALAAVGETHEAEGHQIDYHPASGEVHHEHPEGEAPEKLAAMCKDMEAVPGVVNVIQSPEKKPEGEGWEKAFPPLAEENADEQPTIEKPKLPMENKDKWARPRVAKWLAHVVKFAPKKVRDAMDAPADSPAATEEPDQSDETDEQKPDGVETAQQTLEYLEGRLDAMEPEPREFWETMINLIREHANERYPGHDFGGESTNDAEATKSEEPKKDDADDKAADAALDQYQHMPKHFAVGAAKRMLYVKQLNRRNKGIVAEAADHLAELGGKEAGTAFRPSEKSACRYHHGMLTKCMKDMGMGDDDAGMEGKALEAERIKALKAITSQPSSMAKMLERVTGKRIG